MQEDHIESALALVNIESVYSELVRVLIHNQQNIMLNDLRCEPSRSEAAAPKHQSSPTLASLVGASSTPGMIVKKRSS